MLTVNLSDRFYLNRNVNPPQMSWTHPVDVQQQQLAQQQQQQQFQASQQQQQLQQQQIAQTPRLYTAAFNPQSPGTQFAPQQVAQASPTRPQTANDPSRVTSPAPSVQLATVASPPQGSTPGAPQTFYSPAVQSHYVPPPPPRLASAPERQANYVPRIPPRPQSVVSSITPATSPPPAPVVNQPSRVQAPLYHPQAGVMGGKRSSFKWTSILGSAKPVPFNHELPEGQQAVGSQGSQTVYQQQQQPVNQFQQQAQQQQGGQFQQPVGVQVQQQNVQMQPQFTGGSASTPQQIQTTQFTPTPAFQSQPIQQTQFAQPAVQAQVIPQYTGGAQQAKPPTMSTNPYQTSPIQQINVQPQQLAQTTLQHASTTSLPPLQVQPATHALPPLPTTAPAPAIVPTAPAPAPLAVPDQAQLMQQLTALLAMQQQTPGQQNPMQALLIQQLTTQLLNATQAQTTLPPPPAQSVTATPPAVPSPPAPAPVASPPAQYVAYQAQVRPEPAVTPSPTPSTPTQLPTPPSSTTSISSQALGLFTTPPVNVAALNSSPQSAVSPLSQHTSPATISPLALSSASLHSAAGSSVDNPQSPPPNLTMSRPETPQARPVPSHSSSAGSVDSAGPSRPGMHAQLRMDTIDDYGPLPAYSLEAGEDEVEVPVTGFQTESPPTLSIPMVGPSFDGDSIISSGGPAADSPTVVTTPTASVPATSSPAQAVEHANVPPPPPFVPAPPITTLPQHVASAPQSASQVPSYQNGSNGKYNAFLRLLCHLILGIRPCAGVAVCAHKQRASSLLSNGSNDDVSGGNGFATGVEHFLALRDYIVAPTVRQYGPKTASASDTSTVGIRSPSPECGSSRDTVHWASASRDVHRRASRIDAVVGTRADCMGTTTAIARCFAPACAGCGSAAHISSTTAAAPAGFPSPSPRVDTPDHAICQCCRASATPIAAYNRPFSSSFCDLPVPRKCGETSYSSTSATAGGPNRGGLASWISAKANLGDYGPAVGRSRACASDVLPGNGVASAISVCEFCDWPTAVPFHSRRAAAAAASTIRHAACEFEYITSASAS